MTLQGITHLPLPLQLVIKNMPVKVKVQGFIILFFKNSGSFPMSTEFNSLWTFEVYFVIILITMQILIALPNLSLHEHFGFQWSFRLLINDRRYVINASAVNSHSTCLKWVQRCQTGWDRCSRASKVTTDWSRALCEHFGRCRKKLRTLKIVNFADGCIYTTQYIWCKSNTEYFLCSL